MLVGALAMFFALDVSFLVSLAGMPFVADSLGQAIIDVLPGWISIPLIDALHQWAKILLVVGVIALFLIDGAATGFLAASPRRRTAAVLGIGLLPWVAAFVLARVFSSQRIEPVTSLIDAAAGAAGFLAALALILPIPQAGPAYWETPTPPACLPPISSPSYPVPSLTCTTPPTHTAACCSSLYT